MNDRMIAQKGIIMRSFIFVSCVVGLISACQANQPRSQTSDPDAQWALTHWNGQESKGFSAVLQAHEIAGTAHCNTFKAPVEHAQDTINVGPILQTRRACPDLARETAFLLQLQETTKVAITDDRLTLTTSQGHSFQFVRRAAP